jgi:hypothetical protein
VIDPGIVLPLAIAAIIAVVLVAFVQRASAALLRRRREERARDDALALWERADAALRIMEDLAGSMRDKVPEDAVPQRGAPGAPLDMLTELDRAITELRRVAADIASAGASPGLDGLGLEVERGLAAGELVRRGCGGAAGQTLDIAERRRALKRGYIEIVHAREAVVGRLAGLSGAVGPSDRQRPLGQQRSRPER